MPDLSVETKLTKWENLHYCRFIRIALIIQVQYQESMRLLSNMRFLASYAY